MLSGTASRFLWLTDFPTFQDNYSISHSPLMTSLLISLKKKKKKALQRTRSSCCHHCPRVPYLGSDLLLWARAQPRTPMQGFRAQNCHHQTCPPRWLADVLYWCGPPPPELRAWVECLPRYLRWPSARRTWLSGRSFVSSQLLQKCVTLERQTRKQAPAVVSEAPSFQLLFDLGRNSNSAADLLRFLTLRGAWEQGQALPLYSQNLGHCDYF